MACSSCVRSTGGGASRWLRTGPIVVSQRRRIGWRWRVCRRRVYCSTRSSQRWRWRIPMNRLLTVRRTVAARAGRKRGLLSGWDLRQAVMAVANMVESLLHGASSDDAELEDHVESSIASGDRVPAAVVDGSGAPEHRVHRPAV